MLCPSVLCMHMCVSECVCVCRLQLQSTLVIISYAWSPNPHWHLEWVSKGAFCTIPWFYCRWKGLNRREEKAFCTFSQQLNNPHALRIDGLPRESERGRDGERGRKRGRAWVFGSKGACWAWWSCGTFVCVCVCVYAWRSVGSSLGPGWGAPLSKVFVVELTRVGSFLVGTRRSMNTACWIWQFPHLCFRFVGLFSQPQLGLRKTQI